MRYFLLFSVMVLSTFVSIQVKADDIVVESKVVSATMYNDRATLTREATLQIPVGAHKLVFKNLPLHIVTDSLRVKGTSSSSADVVFGALEHKRTTSEEYTIPQEKKLNAKIQSLQDQNKIYRAEKEALGTAKIFLQNLGKNAALRESEEIAKLELNLEGWSKAADGLSTKMAENLKAALTLDIKIRETQGKIRALQRELGTLHTGQKDTYQASLPFESDKEAKITVALSYQVSRAGWHPIYDARLDTKTGEIELTQYGILTQHTGEDWENVKLTLSTARPSQGTKLPDLKPYWVSLHEPDRVFSDSMRERVPSFDMAKSSMVGGMNTANDELVVQKRDIKTKSAQIEEKGFIGEYIISGLVNVKADGTKAKALIGRFENKSTFEVQVKPQISTQAYLVAKMTLEGEAPLLPGYINIFRDGAFIGQTYTKTLHPEDEAKIAFGTDDNISVKRNLIKDKKEEKGLISKDTIQERRMITRIKNGHKTPVKLVVLETVPSSRDKDITVNILKKETTKGYDSDVDNIKGLLRWSMDLEPAKEAEIKLGWKVSWPEDENISGL